MTRLELARALYEMFEMRTSRSWDQVGDGTSYPGMHDEWLATADELIERKRNCDAKRGDKI
jgi:hypothetical protein